MILMLRKIGLTEENYQILCENGETITAFSTAVSDLVTGGLDKMTEAFKWILSNGDALGTALKTIGAGLAVGAIAAHPYASALVALVGAMTWLADEGKKANEQAEAAQKKLPYQSFKEWAASDTALPMNYTDEQLKYLEEYAAISKRIEEIESTPGAFAEKQLTDRKKELKEMLQPGYGTIWDDMFNIGGILDMYDQWRNQLNASGAIDETFPDYIFDAPYEVPLTVASDAENTIQAEISGMSFEALVKMMPDTSQLAMLGEIATGGSADGNHASGLRYVPRDNYRANLHLGEIVRNPQNGRILTPKRQQQRGIQQVGKCHQ